MAIKHENNVLLSLSLSDQYGSTQKAKLIELWFVIIFVIFWRYSILQKLQLHSYYCVICFFSEFTFLFLTEKFPSSSDIVSIV